MAIMKASDLLQEMIDSQWKEYIEPEIRKINKSGYVYCGFEENSNISENLLIAPAFKEQLLKAEYNVYLSPDGRIIRGISWEDAIPGKPGKEIYPEDEADECE